MLESVSFTYNGESCEDLGVVMVNSSGGLYKEDFLPNRKIVESTVAGSNTPYFKRVDNEPLSFSISIYIKNWKEEHNIRRVSRWLFQDYYKPLYFESNPHRIFYAIFQGKSELLHNGLKEGYITLNIRCNSPFAYSPIKNEKLSVNGTLTKQFVNLGDRMIRPKMKITKIGNGNISVSNNDNGQIFTLNGLENNEVIEVDCANELLKSSYEARPRYLFDSHNDVWLDFAIGKAEFTFSGNFNIEFMLEYVYLNEFDVLDTV